MTSAHVVAARAGRTRPGLRPPAARTDPRMLLRYTEAEFAAIAAG